MTTWRLEAEAGSVGVAGGRAVRLVILADQRPGVGAHDRRDTSDVSPGVEVAAAGGEVPLLDPADDGFPDAGPLTDLRHGETGLTARFRQRVTDAHAAPPLACRTCRPRA